MTLLEIGFAGAFLGGVLTLVSPCSAMLLPSFFAYAFGSRTRLVGRVLVFFVGLCLTLVPLGVFAGTLGAVLVAHRGAVVAVAAAVMIVLGLLTMAGWSFRLPVLLLGAVYGVAGGCAGPVLGSILSVAALGQNPVYGGLLLAVYALGMAVPVLVLALVWEGLRIGERAWLRPRPVRLGPIRTTAGQLISGALFVAIGVLFLLTEGTTALGGLLGAGAQFELEAAVTRWGGAAGNVIFVIVLVAVTVTVIALRGRSRERAQREPRIDR